MLPPQLEPRHLLRRLLVLACGLWGASDPQLKLSAADDGTTEWLIHKDDLVADAALDLA